MHLTINGETREFDSADTLGAFLAARGLNAKMVVVEHNGVIVPRTEYDAAPLSEGDVLEIVQMMAGG